MKAVNYLFLASLLGGSLALTGCKNGNLFGGLHQEGTGDSASLISDANAALADGDYASALKYFEDALAQDPSNSDALYGAAVAKMGNSGLNVGQLVANLMTNGTPGGAPALSSGLAAASLGGGGAVGTDSQSILFNIDIDALDAGLEKATCYLQRIKLGLGDGSVAPNDVNMLVNLALCRILRAATQPLQQGLVDIRKTPDNQNYQFDRIASAPFNGGQCAVVEMAVRNVVWGYQALNEAAVIVLGQRAGNTLFDLQNDFRTLYTNNKTSLETDTGCDFSAVNDNPDLEPAPTTPGNCL